MLSYAQMAIGTLVSLLYTPLMIRLLGKSEYGLYNTVSSIIAMLSILSLGFNSSYVRYYAKYKVKNDNESIAKLNGLFLIIFIIIGAVAFACGTFLTLNLELVFDKGLTASEYETARILMFLLTINLTISFPMSVFSTIISAHEKYIFLKLLGMMKTVFSPLLSIPLMLMGYKAIAIVCVTIFIALVTDTAYLIYSKRILKVNFNFRNFEKGLFKSIFAFTFFIAINIIVDQVNSNLGKFILGRYRGTEAVAVFAVGHTLYHHYIQFSTAISGVFTPRIHKIVNATAGNEEKQIADISSLFIKVGRIQFLILALICTGIIFFGREFIAFWAGSGYENAYYVTLLLVISSSIALIQNLGIEIQRALNKHKFRSVVYIIMATINLGLTTILCKRLGVIGTAVGTAVSLIVANGFIMNIYYHKKCNINIIAFWKSIARMALGLIPALIFGVVLKKYFDFYAVYSMLLGIIVYIAVYFASMWLFAINSYEKGLITKLFAKVLKRRKAEIKK